MPAVTYYLTTLSPRLTVPVAAYSFKRTFWREPKIYRDNFQPLKQGVMENAGAVVNSVTDIPVVALDDTTYVAGGAASTMTVKAASPDNYTHHPHRVDWLPKSGYAFALVDGATIPDPPLPTTASACTFDAVAATDVLTQATGTWWPETGDIVTAGTAGNGLTTTALYTFVRISATTGKLMLAGAIVDISGAITGVTLALVTGVTLPDPVASVLYVSDPVMVSTSAPV